MVLRQFNEGDSLLPCDGRETFQKIIQRLVGLNVVDEGLHRNTCTFETRGAAEAIRIGPYNFTQDQPLLSGHVFTITGKL